ncbi:alpha-galactosidase [Mucilaginibacter boryungensis]|uniref:Alpha-galactosidase n=1 Tax=Mucilaginibacter boryungensis TaxID=768480 RepID=A0ABR9XEI5_9SPHI|nr:alpha-galactosidase [Mucilaginibacter boryungensis]MBE9665792.1 alpha-galactosidase [Mucilaginibacter boryungensis]
MIKKSVALLFFAAGFVAAQAQSIKQIIVETKDVSLVFKVYSNNRVYQTYFGKKLANTAEYAGLPTGRKEAYITGGMEDQNEPAIKVTHTDGNPSLLLQYVADKQDKQGDMTETTIELKDPKYPVEVVLHYQAYEQENVIKAWTEIKNDEKGALTLTNYASNMLHFDAAKYYLTQFHGDWATEMKEQESQLTSGIKVIDSKLGTRADKFQAPMFMLALNKPADEASGEVVAATLAWTGNFQFQFEIDEINGLRVISGINPYASEYHLAQGKTFTTPALIFTYSNTGKGQATRNIHKWARNYGVMDGKGTRVTLLNNWEATGFKFDEQMLVGLFDGANKLGVDLFLLDDGWFGNKYPRSNDKAGLGDWEANKTILPHDVEYLVKQAEAKGIKFGIWLEPEMVNPKSELYEKHPEWILKLPNREENYQRNQLVLDLTNPKVQDYVYSIVDNLLTKNPGVAYIKWDCNRTMSNTYSPYLKDKQSHLYVDYTLGLYKVLDRVRAKYPTMPMMLCSGGGGRTDYAAMKYFTEFWPSDNTDPVERVFIQWGYSNFFPALTVSNHITSWNKTASLKFRTDVAMMGRMGYDMDVKKMTEAEIKFSHAAVATYNRIKPVIFQGDLYRLVSPYEENRADLMYVSDKKDKAILFNYVLNKRYKEPFTKIKMQGLDAQKQYKVQEINLVEGAKAALQDNGKIFSGEYLMTIGVGITTGSAGQQSSNVIEVTQQ